MTSEPAGSTAGDQLAAAGSPHPVDPGDDQVTAAASSFAMLAEPVRIRMLWALRDGEQDVTALAAAAGVSAAGASQHLAKLRLSALVDTRKDGNRRLYRLRGAHVYALLTEALFHADHQVTGHPTHD